MRRNTTRSTSKAERVGDVGADRVVKQLVEADDAHQAETKRQPDRHQEKDAAQAQAENNARGQQLHADHRLPPWSAASPASMMNTSTKPITSSQLPSALLSTSFMPV